MAWENEGYEEEMKREIQKVVCDFLEYHKVKRVDTEHMKTWLKGEAERLAMLRASGTVDRAYKELINPINPEVPTRLIKQFKRIYICLKSLDKNYTDERTKEIISHIVDSTGNKVRQMVLDALQHTDDWVKIIDMQQATRLGRLTVKSQLEMLWNLRVISKKIVEERKGAYVASDWEGHETFKGGHMEDVTYYRYGENHVTTDSTTTNKRITSYIRQGG